MNWKTAVLAALMIGAIIFMGAKFFLNGKSSEDQAVVKTLLAQHGEIESRLARIEKTLSSLSKEIERVIIVAESNRALTDGLSSGGDPRPGSPTPPMLQPNTVPSPSLTGKPMARVKTSRIIPAGDPAAWVGKLSESKREEVMGAFGRHAQAMRDAISDGPGTSGKSPEEIGEILERQNQILKSELKGILTKEDYDLFLNSLPPLLQ